jgi:hypothetical protein
MIHTIHQPQVGHAEVIPCRSKGVKSGKQGMAISGIVGIALQDGLVVVVNLRGLCTEIIQGYAPVLQGIA